MPEPTDPEETDDLPEAPDAGTPIADLPFTSADFHNVVQKHVLNAVYEVLVDQKLDWHLVAPFLSAARDICRSDIQEGADLRIHTVRAEGDGWVEAEEAYLGLSVADRDDGQEWLSETWWLSDIATAEDDPEQVRAIARALERSLARVNAWLAEREKSEEATSGGSD